jgi:hypothetical protein
MGSDSLFGKQERKKKGLGIRDAAPLVTFCLMKSRAFIRLVAALLDLAINFK